LKFLQENRFKQAYEKLTQACFNLRYQEPGLGLHDDASHPPQKRILIDT